MVNPQDTGGVVMIDMGSVVGNMFAPVGSFLGLVIKIIVCGGCAILFGALASVSYTHLDVYKRQVQPCLKQRYHILVLRK